MNISAKLSTDGKRLMIELDAETINPPTSASGKTLLVASTHGNVPTAAAVKGQALIVSVNAYIRR
jgi:hypothetical protein